MDIPSFNSVNIKDYIPQQLTLSNDIPVYCFENKDMEVICMKFVFYHAGVIFQDKYFVSSLTKTQLAQDTRDYSALSLADAMDYYGVNFSPITSNERTILNFAFIKEYQSEVLKLIEQIILHPLFKQDKLDITLKNCKQEFQTKCRQTSFLAHREFMANLFGKDNPYGKYASVSDYDKVSSEDLQAFYTKRYTFNQCYIILAGHTDKEFFNLLNNTLGTKRWNETTADTSIKPIIINNNYECKTIITPLQSAVQSSICIGKMFPSITDKDYIPLGVLNCLLGGYFNSRLMSNIREQKGFTYGIDSFIVPYTYGSVFMITTDVTADKDKDTMIEIFKEIEILQSIQVSNEELDTVKHYIIGEMLRNNDGVSEIAETFDQLLRFNLPQNYNSTSMDIVKNTNAKDLMRLAKHYLSKDSFIVSISKNIE